MGLLDRLDELAGARLPAPLSLYQSWARRVIRYSFQTVRLAAESAPQPPDPT